MTVISESQNEYLCPFFKRAPSSASPYTQEDLLVAKVQVKYGTTTPAWTEIVTKVDKSPASEALNKPASKKAAMDSFTVLYTSSGKVPAPVEMSQNVVYYDRAGMDSYTAKLGPLRYDYEKAEEACQQNAEECDEEAL